MRGKLKKQRGDEEFVELATARGAHLLRTAYLLTGDWHLGEDLVQEALGTLNAPYFARQAGPVEGEVVAADRVEQGVAFPAVGDGPAVPVQDGDGVAVVGGGG